MSPGKLIKFDPPLELKNKDGSVRKIASMALREPIAREVRDAERAYAAASGPVAARMRDRTLLEAVAGADADIVKAMPVSVYNAAVAFLRGFVEAPPEADYSKDRPTELTVTLDEAIEQSGQHWDALTLHEPTTGDVEMAEQEMNAGMDTETLRKYQIVLVSRVSKAPRFIIERLPVRKLDEAARYIGGFIRAGREAGAD